MINRLREKRKKSFTLVEIMLAAAILVSIMAVFLSSFNTQLQTTNYSQGISLATRAAQNKSEEIINSNFDTIIQAYGAAPNNTFDFNSSGLIGKGLINVADRRDLYDGGEHCVTNNANWSVRDNHAVVAYDDKMWVMGGSSWLSSLYKNDVWYSTDGANWTCAIANASWSARRGHKVLVYENKMWLLGGGQSTPGVVKNDVWYSADGTNWFNATSNAGWQVRWEHAAVSYNNKMWVMGGIYNTTRLNDVWYSANGVNWTCATAGAGWCPRSSHKALVYNNKMWVIGGFADSGPYKNDVWYSTDGGNWTCAIVNANWTARSSHDVVVYDNKMWVIGGGYSDAWYSTDGANWTCATNNTSWLTASGAKALVYKNKMWLMGGDYMGASKNDVWYSNGYNRLLEVFIGVSWRHSDGRQFGEDANLDGVWNNTTEDANGNGLYDTPAQARALITDDKSGNLFRIFLGKQ